eukprot:g2265.t1
MVARRWPLGVGALALAASLCVAVLARDGRRVAGGPPDSAGIGTRSSAFASDIALHGHDEPHPSPAPLDNRTLRAFRSWGFGMVSYYDTFSKPATRRALIEFIQKYNITLVNQYVCANTNSKFFAGFVNQVHAETGAHVNVLFDDTLVTHSTGSTCDIPCVKGKSKPQGYCCGSVARKFAWLVDVIKHLHNRTSINGAAFDIEGLRDTDFLRLFQTMRYHWDKTVVKQGGGHQILRWYFGSGLGELAALAVGKGLIDQILWENYENSDDSYAQRAMRVLGPLEAVFANSTSRVAINGPPIALLSETNCCQKPCANGNKCGACNTVTLPAREEISFCSLNKVHGQASQHMSVQYMLDTLTMGRDQLWLRGYGALLFKPIMYDYRALHILLEGTDAIGVGLCPKTGSHALNVSAGTRPTSFFGMEPENDGQGFMLLH